MDLDLQELFPTLTSQNLRVVKGPLEVTSLLQAYSCTKLSELALQTEDILLGTSVSFMILL